MEQKELLLLPPFIRIPCEWDMTRRVMSHSYFLHSIRKENGCFGDFLSLTLPVFTERIAE